MVTSNIQTSHGHVAETKMEMPEPLCAGDDEDCLDAGSLFQGPGLLWGAAVFMPRGSD